MYCFNISVAHCGNPPTLNHTQITNKAYQSSLYVDRTDLHYIDTVVTYTCTHGYLPSAQQGQITSVCEGETDPPEWSTNGECLRKFKFISDTCCSFIFRLKKFEGYTVNNLTCI